MHAQTTASATTTLIPPYGGRLVDLMVPDEELAEARAYASTLPSLQMSPRAVCDLELLASGGVLAARPLHGRGRLPPRARTRCGSPTARSSRSR